MDALANDHNATSNKAPLIEKKPKAIRIMQTPCKHKFHESCLKSWMDIKLECPFCRQKLPPLE
jgi:RING-finger-containing ubiquitin ligase